MADLFDMKVGGLGFHLTAHMIALAALFVACFAITGYITFRDNSVPQTAIDGEDTNLAELTVTGVASLSGNKMTAGSGFTGTGSQYSSSISRNGDLIVTTIVVDLTGLKSGGTLLDIIGGNLLANCHIGQVTTAKNGTIYAGTMQCLEVPAGGEVDIALYSSTEATGTQDSLVTGLTETALADPGADWATPIVTANALIPLTAFPAADQYLYLVNGDTNQGAIVYTTGILKIELFGYA